MNIGDKITDGSAVFVVRNIGGGGTALEKMLTAMSETISALQSKVTELENTADDENNFAVLYPGGTEGAPATISKNERVVIDNPFPGYFVECYVQVKLNESWGETGWYDGDSYSAQGVRVYHHTSADKIVVQSGKSAVLGPSNGTGNPFSNTTSSSSLPFRVIVHKLVKIEESEK